MLRKRETQVWSRLIHRTNEDFKAVITVYGTEKECNDLIKTITAMCAEVKQ